MKLVLERLVVYDSNMPLVSIIVPVYNVAPYLHRCIDSLLAQTLEDIEIICVDDGSSDESPRILDEYANRDSRIRVIHQENSGVSVARNVGLTLVSSPYVGFVDADDWVEPETYQAAVRHMQDGSVDLVCWGNCTWIEQDGLLHKERETSPRQTRFSVISFSQRCTLTDRIKRDIINVVWNKLYNINIIRSHHVSFSPSFFQFEDFIFNAAYLAWAKHVYFINRSLYNHRSERQGSIMTSFSRNKPSVYLTVMQVFEKVYNYYVEKEKVQDSQFFLSELLSTLLGLGLWFSADKNSFMQEAREFVETYTSSKHDIVLYSLPDTERRTFHNLKNEKEVVRFFPLSFIENICSIVNIGDKKVFRIFGVDIAFDRRYFRRKQKG